MKKITTQPIDKEQFEEIGLAWHTDEDGTNYIDNEMVVVSPQEADAYYEAANTLYDMYVEAAQYVIDNNLFHEIGIPFNLVDIIKASWENDVHWHLYGRFDLAGGLDGEPIKLIEFNADTPTGLYETAVIQWAMLASNGLDEESQFNTVAEAITANFKRLLMLDGDIEEFEKYYDGWKILFSSIAGNAEEETTVKFLQQCAIEAGWNTKFEHLDDVGFDSEKGIFDLNDESFEYWFKLFPWEDIALNENELPLMLNNIVDNQLAIILNPAYTLLFQSKGLLKVLYDLFPDSPYLLQTDDKPLEGKKYVEKKVFGREGANVTIYDENSDIIEKCYGEYAEYSSIYQEFVAFNKDEQGSIYQAGLFFAYEGCGLGFRKSDSLIINNTSKFVGHIIG
jgi:glutathionylspermidine synthase